VDKTNQNPTPAIDAELRIWHAIDVAALSLSKNRLLLGKLFLHLKSLYSERSADKRLTSGHGSFEFETKARGFKTRTVREWIFDFEADRDGKPSTSAGKKARRQQARHLNSAEYERGYKAAMHDFPTASGDAADPISLFQGLLPFEALQAAYRAAAKLYHPDLGGDSALMQRLNEAWSRVEEHYKSVG
jgi:hypothetical protein